MYIYDIMYAEPDIITIMYDIMIGHTNIMDDIIYVIL